MHNYGESCSRGFIWNSTINIKKVGQQVIITLVMPPPSFYTKNMYIHKFGFHLKIIMFQVYDSTVLSASMVYTA